MKNKHLAELLRWKREALGLRPVEVARRMGYKNLSKGSTRIYRWEREGIGSADLVLRLIRALEIDREEVLEAQHKDRADWEAWADESVPMVLVERLIPGVYREQALPETVRTEEDALAYARDHARRNRRKVCLVVSRRVSVWIDRDGGPGFRTLAEPGVLNVPSMQIRGRGKTFVL